MIPELGHFALILALAVALVQGTLPLVGASRGDARLMALGRTAALTQAFLVILAFGALTQAYVTSDFSVANVVANSHSAKPLIYKISGVWGNHEGSMLLWALILSLFGAAVAIFGANLPDTLRSRVLAVQALIGVGFLAFLLFTSNPFERVSPAPLDGNGLNPLLQDPGLAFHPPLLYLGYVGFSVTYSFAIAALLEGRVDAAWARWVRPWTLAAWCFLTLRHRARQLVGLLHPGLGRLLVLGSRRERLADAVARRHRAAAFGHRRREARRAEELDGPAGHPRLLALACSAPSWCAPACSPRCMPSPRIRRAACSSWPSCWPSPAAASRSTPGARRSCRAAACSSRSAAKAR